MGKYDFWLVLYLAAFKYQFFFSEKNNVAFNITKVRAKLICKYIHKGTDVIKKTSQVDVDTSKAIGSGLPWFNNWRN